MRVYHFLPANFALDDIEKHRIKISEIDQLNDPFELWCVSQKDKRLRIGLQRYKEEMSKRYGMLCFSRHWHNPVLWSHYADKHALWHSYRICPCASALHAVDCVQHYSCPCNYSSSASADWPAARNVSRGVESESRHATISYGEGGQHGER